MARRFAAALAVMMTVLLVLAAPSWAHHKAGHSQGGGKSAAAGKSGGAGGNGGGSSSSGYTEDNDTNDNNTPNNVPDGGDNAHPSGNDKSVEPGNSGNQGNSSSDPDDDGRGPDRSNGGPDKPNGSGGVDLADQDGNNGCGNDDDFEDDNEGWCGKPKDKAPKAKGPKDEVAGDGETKPCDEVMGDEAKVCDDDAVLGTVFSRVRGVFDLDASGDDRVLGAELTKSPEDTVAAADEAAAAGTDDEVLGQALAREATAPEAEEETGALPFTGASVMTFVLIGVALVISGLLINRRRFNH